MIDLRSDTVTKPVAGMRKAMYDAEVGDDVYGEDPSVNELQEYVADLLGKETALFVPSGSMANQICIAVHTQPGDEVIVEHFSHIFQYETAAPAVISRVQLNCIASENGMMEPAKVKDAIRTPEYYMPLTSLVCIENTHNKHGGTIVELENVEKIALICKENNLKFHCDGARLWHALTEREYKPEVFAQSFDTVSTCFSKGLGAPAGSTISGSRDIIDKARKWRKILGGGMRQSGILAAAALYAHKNHFPLLKEDHEKAKYFANLINQSDMIEVDLKKVQTNMVVLKLDDKINPDVFCADCKDNGLLLSHIGNNKIRVVFHFQISEFETKQAADIVLKSAR